MSVSSFSTWQRNSQCLPLRTDGDPRRVSRARAELGNAIVDVETRKDLSANPVVELAEIAIELGEQAQASMIDC